MLKAVRSHKDEYGLLRMNHPYSDRKLLPLCGMSRAQKLKFSSMIIQSVFAKQMFLACKLQYIV
jgi:hypothetical protein